MSRVVCQVLAHPRRLTFRWSESEHVFEPYFLEGEELRRFWELATEARRRLRELVDAADQGAEVQAGAALTLAQPGQQLYRCLFPQAGPFRELTTEIRGWLQQEHAAGRLESLEILGDVIEQVPWTVVCESESAEQAFIAAPANTWGCFWGVRYNLTVTHRCNPLRPVARIEQPDVLLALDPQAQARLSQEQRDGWQRFVQARSLTAVESATDLWNTLAVAVPDLLYLSCSVDERGLLLNDAPLSLETLSAQLRGSHDRLVPWNSLILVVNPVGAPAADHWNRIRKQLAALRLGGLVMPDHPLPAPAAGQFGLDLLERLVNRGEPLGAVVRDLRTSQAPSGLVWTAACPPRLQVSWGGDEGAATASPDDASAAAESLPLPPEPYRPLAACDWEDRPLLAARDDDIAAFAELIDTAAVRLALLQGRSGVGKSSLLRAGVVPLLDHDMPGYCAVRDRTPQEESVVAEKDYPILTTRATNDLAAQLALTLAAFAAQPFSYTTPTGRTVVADLPAVLRRELYGTTTAPSTAVTEKPPTPEQVSPEGQEAPPAAGPWAVSAGSPLTPAELYAALQEDSALLGRLLRALGEQLPSEPLLVIEQGEELFTLTRTSADVARRQQALALLRSAAESTGHAKIVLSLRTEYFGRLVARLRPEAAGPGWLADYLLAALNADQLTEVILRPTLEESPPYTDQVPFEQYRFRYQDGLARRIAVEALQAANAGREEALPLIQAVCFTLHLRVAGRSNPTITDADLRAVKGVQGSLVRYILESFGRLVPKSSLARYIQESFGWMVPTNDKWKFLPFLEKLYVVQPDGLVTRALRSEQELAITPANQESKPLGSPALGQLYALYQRIVDPGAQRRHRALLEGGVSADRPLLEEVVILTEEGEDTRISIRQDAAALALRGLSEQEQEKKPGKILADTVWICLSLMVLVAVLGYLYGTHSETAKVKALQEEREMAKKMLEDEKQKQHGREGERWARYIAQMQQAETAWQVGDMLGLRQLLLAQKQELQPDMRGFEWYVHWQRLHGERKTFEGHQAEVAAVALSPDRRWLVSASRDGAVKVWDLQTKLLLGAIPSQEGSVNAVAFAPRGNQFAAAGGDKIIRLYKWKNGEAKSAPFQDGPQLRGHKGPVAALVFAPDGKTLLSAGEDGTVRLWDVGQWDKAKLHKTLQGHKGMVHALAMAPDGQSFASGGADRKVIVWDLEARKERHTLEGHTEPVQALAFAADGKTLASAGSRYQDNMEFGEVRFWDPTEGKETGKALVPAAGVLALAFATKDGKVLATGGKGNSVQLWDVHAGQVKAELKGHLGWVGSLAIDNEGQTLATGSYDSLVKVWDQPRPADTVRVADDWVCSLALTPDNKRAAAGCRDGTIKVYDVATGEEVKTLAGHKGSVLALAFAKQGDKLLLASGSAGQKGKPGQLLIHDAASGQLFKELTGPKEDVAAVVFAPNGTLLAVASGAQILVWDSAHLQKATPRHTLTKGTGVVRCLALAPDGTRLASGGDDATVRLWDMTAELPSALVCGEAINQHLGAVLALAFSSDGKALVSGSVDRAIKLWDANDRQEIATLRGHSGAIAALAFSADSATIASASRDSTVKLWDVRPQWRGLARHTFADHQGPVRGVAFTADFRVLLSVGHDGMLRFRRAAAVEKME